MGAAAPARRARSNGLSERLKLADRLHGSVWSWEHVQASAVRARLSLGVQVGDLLVTGSHERAWSASRRLLGDAGGQRVLAISGVSGMGKSGLLALLAESTDARWNPQLIDAEGIVRGMARPDDGADKAALMLLRKVGRALADGAPWWRVRSARGLAAQIGASRRVSVRVRLATICGQINRNTIAVDLGSGEQERRAAWARDLLRVAWAVRGRRCLLLLDTCEWLTFFDHVHATADGRGPVGVGGWFALGSSRI